jgi:proline iminopeptidase
MINECRRFERLLELEQVFTVVYWDQRGCGRSLRTPTPVADISFDQMTDDTVHLLALLRERFRRPVHVVGFSLGATVALSAAARRPDLVTRVVAVGTDVDGVAAATNAYGFALDAARARGNRRAIRQLEEIGAPPHLKLVQFATRVRWVMNFGGTVTGETYNSVARALAASLIGSSAYSTSDVVRTLRGVTRTQAALLPELATLDLATSVPSLDVPIVMAQGRLDQVSPAEVAVRYVDAVKAPSKELVWFDRSAHMPQLEEPAKFRDLLMRVLTEGDDVIIHDKRVTRP